MCASSKSASADAPDKSPSAGGTGGQEPKQRSKSKKGGGESGGRVMKRPKKEPLGLKSLTKATRVQAAPRSFHAHHSKPVCDPRTGRVVMVKPRGRPVYGNPAQSFHHTHAKPVYDPATGRYVTARVPRAYTAQVPSHTPRSQDIAALTGGNRVVRRGRAAAKHGEVETARLIREDDLRERVGRAAEARRQRAAGREAQAEADRREREYEATTRAEEWRIAYHQHQEDRRIAREILSAARAALRNVLD